MSNLVKASVVSLLGAVGFNLYSHAQHNETRQRSQQVRAERIAQSPQFLDGKVISRMPSVESPEKMSSVMYKFFFERSNLKPQQALPFIAIDEKRFEQPHDAPRVTWLGHSSLFIELDQQKLLVDPVFDYASPWLAQKLFSRNVAAPIARESLPLPDAIVISHDHYDHLEESTVRYYADKAVRFYVPLGVGKHLEGWGIDPQMVTELDWWESAQLGSIQLTAAPANHNSGRTGFDSNQTLWASWAIKGDNGSLFYSGDSAYDTHFKQIGDRLGPFDIAFIEVAANVKEDKGFPVENWGHMQAKHTMQAFLDLGAKQLMPVHWSTYELFAHKWDEPMTDLISEAEKSGAKLVTPMVGQSFELNSEITTAFWWQEPEISLANLQLSYDN
ncbi:MBL fold metallo-hydrolase [Vibrio intestinalis]|uniref:MBL fold metallo-hydrolase n=1 Tax=Vibrio intestinalis TaxID=2933291 RepID=UPI003D816A12